MQKKDTAYPSNGRIIDIYNQKHEMLAKIHAQTSREKMISSLKTCKTFGDSRKPISHMFFLSHAILSHVCFIQRFYGIFIHVAFDQKQISYMVGGTRI